MNNPFLPHTDDDRVKMLQDLNIASTDELFTDIPSSIRLKNGLKLPEPMSEFELKKHIDELAAKNKSMKECISFLGGGVYDHHVPSIVDHLIKRSEFYTSYTPYQAEVSQGILQSIFEYQSMIAELTGMETANASIYDGASAVAEAAINAVANTKREQVIVSSSVNLNYKKVLRTYLEGQGFDLKEVPSVDGVTDLSSLEEMLNDQTACVILQSPNYLGIIEDFTGIEKLLKDKKTQFVAVSDPISLAILEPPAKWGADIVVGDGQSLGNPMSFGGPLLGFFASKKKYIRKMPGRIVGETKDKEGKKGYVMTLQTREQHIRREKATSNICSNQALNVLAACVYMSLMGPEGLKKTAELSLQKAHYARKELEKIGVSPVYRDKPYYKEFLVKLPEPVDKVQRKLLDKNIFAGIDASRISHEFNNCLLISVTEKRTREEIDYFVEILGEVLK
ncbi:aminomethyl-transferring glycine dehydrogenase subunit GcvPA [Natranaerofaba carboxydovora]|uniref:aminomethyl-transferring glycine dehydrogenase subunit GcvPA n=1 Tax=Natranaerofaba carboxydovora TaxID=2742683 RepID=UPI001F14825D|nr:aminomethyl-transferring glycine dehydrogenase subunit GcvPA [Natranaerofaba carboxydovora]UMZ74300.1 putative glycine dehydrogenase (decarboxylating) subunit 1 [Natranaerofaba carboxydovora]